MTGAGYGTQALPATSCDSEKIDKLSIIPSYQEFLAKYLMPNRPVIIGENLVRSWAALTLWTRTTSGGAPGPSTRDIDWDYLSNEYGDCEVTVADCSAKDSFGNLECDNALFRDVVAKWQAGEGQSLYVKDWHLARSVESASLDTPLPFYEAPDIFKDDWMNAYYSAHTCDDFRFVYVGAAGTFTPLHRDVYCSYSWSTNVCGRKRWWLFPPEQTSCLFMKARSVCLHDVRDVDSSNFPDYAKARPIIVEQEEGETIFVPSGWYHQVENLTACISINHNWCNSVNLPMLFSSMCDKVIEVENALEDVRDLLKSSHPDNERAWKTEFCAVVQDLVQQDAGWNWLTFWTVVAHVLESAVDQEGKLPESMKSPAKSSLPSQPLFPCPHVHLRPSLSFIEARVRSCYEDFMRRDKFECEGDVRRVVDGVFDLLEAARSGA